MESFIESLNQALDKYQSVQTPFGQFVRMRTGKTKGVNPRTKKPIEVAGKSHTYFFVSEKFFSRIFKESSGAFSNSHQQELGRFSSRGFGDSIPPVANTIECEEANIAEVATNALSQKKFLFKGLGTLKVFAGNPPLVFFSPGGD